MRLIDQVVELSAKYPTCFKPTAYQTIARRFFLDTRYVTALYQEKHKDTTYTHLIIAYVVGKELCAYRLAKGQYLIESNYHNDIAFYDGLWELVCMNMAGMKLDPPDIPKPAELKPSVFRAVASIAYCYRGCKRRGIQLTEKSILRALNFIERKSYLTGTDAWIDKHRQTKKEVLLQFAVMARKLHKTAYVEPYENYWIIQSDMAWVNFLCTVRPTIREKIKKALKE